MRTECITREPASYPDREHDWRHLEQHARYENVNTPDEVIVTVDYWYCTRCRRIESSERERIKAGDE